MFACPFHIAKDKQILKFTIRHHINYAKLLLRDLLHLLATSHGKLFLVGAVLK